MEIDISANIPGCSNFYWYELLYCPRWKVHVQITEKEYQNGISLGYALEDIRAFLGVPLTPSSGIRPRIYNRFIGGAKRSMHIFLLACDFHALGFTGNQVRGLLVPKLKQFGIRMEDLPGSKWVHIDLGKPRPNRFFKP